MGIGGGIGYVGRTKGMDSERLGSYWLSLDAALQSRAHRSCTILQGIVRHATYLLSSRISVLVRNGSRV